jgi:hypothetical protein
MTSMVTRYDYYTLNAALDAFGPGWHPLVRHAFALVERAPWFVLAPGLRLGRQDAGLGIRVDSECYSSWDAWLRVQMPLTALLQASRDICEACGVPAFRPEPRRSTRSHCSAHAMDWASGLPEAVIWAASEGWREGTERWTPETDQENDG